MPKKNLSKIAKSAVAEPKKNSVASVNTKKVIETKSLTATPLSENERDKIAKETVANLLSEVNIPQIGQIVEEIIEPKPTEVDESQVYDQSTEEEIGIDQEKVWLEEQIQILNNKNETLLFELEQMRNGFYGQNNDYMNQNNGFNGENNEVIKNTITLYVKIQNIYDSFVRNGGKLMIEPKQFLLELESFFPYLVQYRRRLLDE